MIRAYTQPTPFNVVFLNPLISVLPRLLVGWMSAYVFQALTRNKTQRWHYSITALIGTLLNTVLVLGGIYLFAGETYANALGVSESALLGALGVTFVTNGVIEIIASMIILPLVALPLSRALKRRNQES